MERDGNTGMLELKQIGLDYIIIESLGFDFGTTKGKWTRAEYTTFVKEKYGEHPTGYLSYSSVVRMILYLAKIIALTFS